MEQEYIQKISAALQQKLLNEGKTDKGIIVCEGYDYEIIEKKPYKPYDNLGYLSVVLKPDGNMKKDSRLCCGSAHKQNKVTGKPLKISLQIRRCKMVSFTITEKDTA